jgi:putrescine aminotransferase
MLDLLTDLQGRYPDLVAEVRGRGLMIGVEFATDEIAELTVMRMLGHGMCAAFTLNNPRVVRLEPPLIISEDEVRTAVGILDRSLTEAAALLSAEG